MFQPCGSEKISYRKVRNCDKCDSNCCSASGQAPARRMIPSSTVPFLDGDRGSVSYCKGITTEAFWMCRVRHAQDHIVQSAAVMEDP